MNFGLPLLPGNSFRNLRQTKFHKSQHFLVYNGETMLAPGTKCAIGGRPMTTEGFTQRSSSLHPPQFSPKAPSWLANDKKVLCFYGYFKETLQEMKVSYQVRKVKILFYLEDGAMQVSEPRTLNSGIPQGCLVTRQRIPRPDGRGYVEVLDLNVGQPITLFDRTYFITGCDQFTRTFLNRCGITVPEDLIAPEDPMAEIRRAAQLSLQPKQPCVVMDNLSRFLENDRKVLRFSGYWDDRDSEFGDVHHMEILFHLADSSIEVKWKLKPNSGYHSNGMFLKRARLPKNCDMLPKPGQLAPFTVLNVLGKGLRGGRYIMDCLDIGSSDIEYYEEQDLCIGAVLNVFGRKVILTDCDDFTKNYYRQKYGVEEFQPLPNPAKSPYGSNRNEPRELPPFNGWGSHEDSEGNCKTVEPKQPHRDFNKFFKYDGFILRFGARLISKIKENNDRAFIILYYLDDDTIAIYEVALKNSGFLGGEFFKRAKIYIPNQQWLVPQRPKTYKPEDFYIGAKMNLRDHLFMIISADRFTLKFMEANPAQFVFSDINLIMLKIRENMRPIYKDFYVKYMCKVHTEKVLGSNVSIICCEEFKEMIIDLLGTNIVEHEIITLCRYFSAETEVALPWDKEVIRSAIHADLSRNLWDDRARVKQHIYHVAPVHNGFLPQKVMVSVIRACKIPLDIALIEKFMAVLNKDSDGNVDVQEFFSFLDPINHPSCPVPPFNIKKDVQRFVPFTIAGKMVDFDAFTRELDLEDNLKKESDQ